ncbi:MAG: hypothetical protein U9Q33_02990 [Campylobacterota bacterium]|nr:hypothetical protein [Campylobacterota bacterium]
MNPAKNIKELKQVFRFNDKYLEEENEKFFVNLYKKDMRKLEIDIEDSEIHYDTFYITGQSGNGKSTAVNQLKKSDAITNIYDVRHIFANDLFDFPDEVTIVDVLLMIGMDLVSGDEKLEKVYLNKLQELKDINVGRLEKSYNKELKDTDTKSAGVYASGELGWLKIFKFGGNLKREFSDSEQSRTLLRKLFLPNRRELLNLINEIIKKHNPDQNKKLLLIIDDLEKRNLSKELFTRDKELLEKIEVLKVIMIPVNYANSGKVYKLSLRLNQNPIKADENDSKPKNNRELLEKLIYKRIDKSHKELIPNSDEILGEIIDKSGGNIRQLLRLIYEASLNTRYDEREAINELDVKESSQELLNLIAIGVNDKQSFLKHIDDKNIPDENEIEKFRESIADNSIFAYFNGQPWYEVNPVIKEYIKSIEV